MRTNLDLKREKNITTDLNELVVWYDEVINLESLIKTIIDVCNFSEKKSTDIALDSLLDGFAIVSTGKCDTLITLQNAFLKRSITTTIR